MKKIILLALFAGSQLGFAQSTQRFVITEEFTQASCPPCASQNPAFNTLLQANTTKTFGLKYQASWPGYDPMNEHNPVQVADRVSYYSVTGVPNAVMDGNVFQGAPANYLQTDLDSRYATASPFDITMTHTVNPTLDSIMINVSIENVSGSAFSSSSTGSLKLHVVLAEQEIAFSTAPGTTAEKEFYGVMKRMVTGSAGFSLPDTWAMSATNTYNYTVAVPIYSYNTDELGVVAFIQEDSNKEILQGDYSIPKADPASVLDVELTDATGTPSGGYCITSVAPIVTIKNNSSTALTSLDLYYKLNGGNAVKVAWTGNVAAGGSTPYTLPSIPLAGPTSIEVFSYIPNNIGDPMPINNYFTREFQVLNPTPLTPPTVYDMESDVDFEVPSGLLYESTSPGNVFAISKSSVTGLTNELGAFGGSTKSIMVDFFAIQSGIVNNLVTGKINLSGISNSKVYFDHAYAQYSTENDKLEVFVSKDCGATWTSVFNKAGANLATAPAISSGRFFPDGSQWARNTIDISAFDGEEIIVKLTATSNYGNTMYLDNILVNDQAISIEENELEGVKVYPNPTKDLVSISLELDKSAVATVVVMNNLGQVVLTNSQETSGELKVDLSNLSTGIYTIKLDVEGKTSTQRVSVIK